MVQEKKINKTYLVRILVLVQVSGSNHTLQRLEEDSVLPFLVLGKLLLHELLDGNHGRTSTVLQLRDGFNDSFFVRHGLMLK